MSKLPAPHKTFITPALDLHLGRDPKIISAGTPHLRTVVSVVLLSLHENVRGRSLVYDNSASFHILSISLLTERFNIDSMNMGTLRAS
jgi:hypothetical protein